MRSEYGSVRGSSTTASSRKMSYVAVADGETRPRAEAVESHVFGGYPPPLWPTSLRSTSAAPSWRRVSCATTARSRARLDAPTPLDLDADALFATLTDLVDRLDASGAAAVGVGCGGPMDARRRARVAAQHPRVARRSRCARGSPRTPACRVSVDNDAKALALGEGWIGRGARRARLHRRWSCRPASAAASCSTAGSSTAPTATPGHIGHVIVEPDGRVCGCGARGCLEAEASGTAIARITGAPAGRGAARGARAHRHARRPRGRVGREPARPPARGRQRLGRARLRRAVLRRRASASSTRAAASTSRAARASSPARSAPTARSSAPPRSPSATGVSRTSIPASRRFDGYA